MNVPKDEDKDEEAHQAEDELDGGEAQVEPHGQRAARHFQSPKCIIKFWQQYVRFGPSAQFDSDY